MREIRATDQEERTLAGLYRKIDERERIMIRGELVTGLFINGAGVIMRLGMTATILVGAGLILSEQIDFRLLFLFLMVITRTYAPFDQSLVLIAELFVSRGSADRMNALFDTPIAQGAEFFHPQGRDIVFDRVEFAYDEKAVLHDVSFTTKEGERTALVGPSGSGCRSAHWDALAGNMPVVRQAADEEVDLFGYTMWSCIDLCAASRGRVSKRYGLVYVDMDDRGSGSFRRCKEDSFCCYQKVIAANGEDLR